MKTCYIFDIDDTLVKPRPINVQKQDLFMYFKPIEEMALIDLFRKVRNDGDPVYLLTTRHPDNKSQICSYFGIPADYVICREDFLTYAEIRRIIHSKTLEKNFLQFINQWKFNKSMEIAYKYGNVEYYDNDMREIIKYLKSFNPEWKITCNFHIQFFDEIKRKLNSIYFFKQE